MPIRTYKSFTGSLVVGLILSTLLGPASAQSNKVRLGYQYSIWGAPAVVALELGLFKSTASKSTPNNSRLARMLATGSSPTA